MPVWHAQLQEWRKKYDLVVLGLIQEQHSERCRLYAQWQRIDWPILHDPINVLNTTAVPIFVAIDEHGVVRSNRARVDQFESEFLQQTFAPPRSEAVAVLTPPLDPTRPPEKPSAADWRSQGDSLALWHPERVDEAIAAYRRALRQNPEDAASHFRLGVCLRMRYEQIGAGSDRNASHDHTGDFAAAVISWEAALERQPNQYIWRRRIQQYGPRLIKPYSFYDWVTQAQADVRARGETPVELAVAPSGAEFASPARLFAVDEVAPRNPDPDAQIHLDQSPLINIDVTSVPTRVEPGTSARLHFTLTPDRSRRAFWNNEVEPLRVWINAPKQGRVSRSMLVGDVEPIPESQEVRRLDVEIQIPEDATGAVAVNGYALYYVCEDVGGECLFLRQEFTVDVPVRTTPAP